MGQNFDGYPTPGTRLISAWRSDFNDIIDALVTTFVGASEPSPTYACMLWADTNQGVLKQRNVANTAWIVRGTLEDDYGGALPLSGGTMEGAINMGGYGITNLPAGSGNAPARYADLAAYVKADGTTAFTGFPTLPSSSPSTDYQAAHKKYADDKSVAGGSFTGQINMTVAPTADNHVMRRTDVYTVRDTHIHSGAASMGSKIEGANLKATGISDGAFLRASGALATWSSETSLSQLVMLDEPLQVLQTDAEFGWTDFDFSTNIPMNTYAVLIISEGYTVNDSGGFYTGYRKDGTSVTSGFPGVSVTGTNTVGSGWEYVTVPVASRIMEHRKIHTGGGALIRRLTIKLCGYFLGV